MTEPQWLTCDNPQSMLECLYGTEIRKNVSERKMRLFAVACVRSVWNEVPKGALREAVEAGELYADGRVSAETLKTARRNLSAALAPLTAPTTRKEFPNTRERKIRVLVHTALHPTQLLNSLPFSSTWRWANDPTTAVQLPLLRDVFGNPFRPVTAEPQWLTSSVVSLARTMYDSRDFAAMPVLADALEEAGCGDASVLAHCRDIQSPHVRGCWVVDLILGRN